MSTMKVDTRAFQEAMRKSGYTLETLASEINLSRTGLFNKVHNKTEFRVSEMGLIASLFKLDKTERDRIFFALGVE